MNVGPKIETRLRELGMNQAELANVMGVKRSAISHLKKKSVGQLRAGTRRSLCAALGVSEDFFSPPTNQLG